jgi:hypothetical protein
MNAGPMDLARERALRARGFRVRVFVRGEDVTRRCRYADDTPGEEYAELYRRGPTGVYLDEDHRPAIEVVRADVQIAIEPSPNG